MPSRKTCQIAQRLALGLATLIAFPTVTAAQSGSFVNWESPQSHPIDITPNGLMLLAVNSADARLEIYDLVGGIPTRRASVPVGLDPVSVRVRSNSEAWVVNQISDSVSVVDLTSMRVTRTIVIGDEPADVVFAGTPQKAYVSLSLTERVAIVDAALPATVTTVTIAGSQPRALAASADGSRVYLAIFESGNHSTMIAPAQVSAVNGPYAGQNPPPNSGTAFSPARSAGQPNPPTVSHIVKKNAAGQWLDGNNRNWTNFVNWDVHDNDIAIIDTQSNAVSYVKGLMTIVAGIGMAPNGDVVAVGIESRNELRFEQNVNGVFVKCMAARLAGGAGPGTVIDMNPHLTYTQPSTSVLSRLQSIGDPRGVAFSADGATTFVAGLGSNNVIGFSSGGGRVATIAVGEGPTGLVMSPSGLRLYVLNRFEGSVSTISTASNSEVARISFHDSTPVAVKNGRKFLFDTHLTSGLGQASCASCHVDARSDRIAWDIGNTQGAVQLFDETCQVPGCIAWHPMKGPMTSQTLIGIIGTEPFHWRGEKNDLAEFNEAYTALQGRDSQITTAEMDSLHDYVASLTFGPNPNRNIDNTMKSSVAITGGAAVGNGGTGNPNNAVTIFNNSAIFGAPPGLTCLNCHSGLTGTNGIIDIPGPGLSQNRKNAPLRDTYRKIGANKASLTNNRGFGFNHAGDEATLQDLLGIGFRWAAGATGLQQRRDMEAFVMSFGVDTHAGAGQQVTMRNAGGSGDDVTRLNQLIAIATSQSSQMGLIAKGMRNGVERGWMLQSGSFVSDRTGESTTAALLLAGATGTSETTYTLVPSGMARRLGIDRDLDNALDRDEVIAGSDPADPVSFPGSCPADIAPLDAHNGQVDGGDLGLLLSNWGLSGTGDLNGDGTVNGSDLGALLSAWGACQ